MFLCYSPWPPRPRNIKDQRFHTFEQADTYPALTAGYGAQTALGTISLEPYANLAHVHLRTSGFTDYGGIAALSGKSSSFDQTFSTLGLRAQSEFELDNGTKIKARGAVGWRRAFNAQTPKAKLNFAGGNVFDIAGVPMTRDSLVLEAGLDAKVSKSMTIGASYVGQISGSQQAHGFKASLNWKF